ncbi:polysaccharide deacetylase family protein [Echinicola sp. 20G]|uniref:polysaccharide deacetylase family protein n=1 Tax=Echinicola sp. 20G TaxID=2781961 RepID=UPI0019100CC8|nr:polysaccharide deacetylase family protein [Echinicola sp. 20G]
MKKKVRNFLAYCVAQTFILSGKVRKAKQSALTEEKILSIYFHKPSKEEFEFAIKWLKKNGFYFISVEDIKAIIKGAMPFPKGAALITVDDGWASNIENMAKVADREKVPIQIFLATEAIEQGNFWFSTAKKANKYKLNLPNKDELKLLPNVERLKFMASIQDKIKAPREAMTVQEIKNILSDFVSVGAHSHSHPILIRCSESELKFEITHSKEKVELWTEKPISTFAYPNGDYGSREIALLKKNNFELAFSTIPKVLTKDMLHDNYCLPRIGFLEGGSKAENICRMVGIWHSNTKVN